MLHSLFSSGDLRQTIINLLLTLPVIIIALSVHESAHGYIAYKMGDRTAFNLGRVTLNPIKHLDPMGTLMMLLVGYGWAKPVPINTRNFKNPKRGMALTALAGPVSNIIIGLIGCILFSLFYVLYLRSGSFLEESFKSNLFYMLVTFLDFLGFYNLGLAVFNLIPLPPFDGSRIFLSFLPARVYFNIMRYERYILIGFLGISVVCSYLFSFSPVSLLANSLFNLITRPLINLFANIFLGSPLF